jgi:hypothetical protein
MPSCCHRSFRLSRYSEFAGRNVHRNRDVHDGELGTATLQRGFFSLRQEGKEETEGTAQLRRAGERACLRVRGVELIGEALS